MKSEIFLRAYSTEQRVSAQDKNINRYRYFLKLIVIAFCFSVQNCPGRIFFEIRRYFSKIAGNSADTAVILLRTADAPLS